MAEKRRTREGAQKPRKRIHRRRTNRDEGARPRAEGARGQAPGKARCWQRSQGCRHRIGSWPSGSMRLSRPTHQPCHRRPGTGCPPMPRTDQVVCFFRDAQKFKTPVHNVRLQTTRRCSNDGQHVADRLCAQGADCHRRGPDRRAREESCCLKIQVSIERVESGRACSGWTRSLKGARFRASPRPWVRERGPFRDSTALDTVGCKTSRETLRKGESPTLLRAVRSRLVWPCVARIVIGIILSS